MKYRIEPCNFNIPPWPSPKYAPGVSGFLCPPKSTNFSCNRTYTDCFYVRLQRFNTNCVVLCIYNFRWIGVPVGRQYGFCVYHQFCSQHSDTRPYLQTSVFAGYTNRIIWLDSINTLKQLNRVWDLQLLFEYLLQKTSCTRSSKL